MLREATVAHSFYPGDPKELENMVQGFLTDAPKQRALAVIVPHAGYIYSGKVAGTAFSHVSLPDTLVLIGPNHTGMGQRAAVMDKGSWQIPLGDFEINEELAEKVIESCDMFQPDTAAHLMEHSLEVQLPFIHSINPRASIVPITMMPVGITECRIMGEALGRVIRDCEKEVLIIISSDMNHYESDSVTREKDRLAIDKVLALDPDGLLSVTHAKGITMCGVVPTAVGLAASMELGAKGARLLDYSTSGETSGDYDQVVGYAAIVIQ